MKSLFDMSFRNRFSPRMGQDDSPFVTDYEDGSSSEGLPGAITWGDVSTPSSTPWEPIPGLVTGYDQGAPAQPVQGIVTWNDLQNSTAIPPKPSGTSDADWQKIVSEGIKAAGAGYGAYSKEQAAKVSASIAAAAAKAGVQVSPVSTSAGISNQTIVFGIAGLAVLGVLAAIAIKK